MIYKIWNWLITNFTKDLYFIAKFNLLKDVAISLLLGMPISILLSFSKTFNENTSFIQNWNDFHFPSVIGWNYFIGFAISFFFKTAIANNITVNYKILKAKFRLGNEFFLLLRSILYDLDNKDDAIKTKKLQETSYFLKTANSRTGRALLFDPDNQAINQLHKVKGMISFTAATPSEWLNPTYNFFLINNYIASITQSILKSTPVSSIKFSYDRSEYHFQLFERSKKDFLKKISELTMENNLIKFLNENKIFIRFYILSEEEIKSNKSIIETLIAGHDLFGCYVYFINKDVIDLMKKDQDVDEKRFDTFLDSIDYKLHENKNKVDLAIALVDNDLEVIYRKEDDLVTRKLTAMNSMEFQVFITKLSKMLYQNYDSPSYLFDSYFKRENYTLNNKFCHLFIEKE